MDVVSRVRVSGPLAGFAGGFAAYLAGAGYTPLSAVNQVRLLAPDGGFAKVLFLNGQAAKEGPLEADDGKNRIVKLLGPFDIVRPEHRRCGHHGCPPFPLILAIGLSQARPAQLICCGCFAGRR